MVDEIDVPLKHIKRIKDINVHEVSKIWTKQQWY